MEMIKKNNATFFLFVNSFLWGSSYVWSKMLLGFLPRFSILFLCSLGGLIVTMLIYGHAIRTITMKTVLRGIGISMFSIISNTFFMIALQHTSSSNTAFIVQMSVIFTPVLMAVWERRMPEKRNIQGAMVALIGLFLLICDFASFRINAGDLFALCNAIFFSLYLVSLRINANKIKPVEFSCVYHATNTVAFLVLAGVFEMQSIQFQGLNTAKFGLLIMASMFIAISTLLIQSKAIKFVRPEKAALIYTFEPVMASVLAFIFIGERLGGIKTFAGLVLILFAVFYTIHKQKVLAKKITTVQN